MNMHFIQAKNIEKIDEKDFNFPSKFSKVAYLEDTQFGVKTRMTAYTVLLNLLSDESVTIDSGQTPDMAVFVEEKKMGVEEVSKLIVFAPLETWSNMVQNVRKAG